jgi:hypothetical protein
VRVRPQRPVPLVRGDHELVFLTTTLRAKDAQPSRQCQRSAGNVSSPFPSISSALPHEEQRRACFIVATNILEVTSLSDEELGGSYKQQGSVERGFRGSLRSALSGFFRLREETGAYGGFGLHHGSLSARLPLRSHLVCEPNSIRRVKLCPSLLNKQTSTPTMRLSCSNVLRASRRLARLDGCWPDLPRAPPSVLSPARC